MLSSRVEREVGSEITVLGAGMTTPSPTPHNGPTPNLGAKLIDYVRWRKKKLKIVCLLLRSFATFVAGKEK